MMHLKFHVPYLFYYYSQGAVDFNGTISENVIIIVITYPNIIHSIGIFLYSFTSVHYKWLTVI